MSQLRYLVSIIGLSCIGSFVGSVLFVSVTHAVGFDPGDNPYVSSLITDKSSSLTSSLGLSAAVTPTAVALSLINAALSLLGTVSLVLLIYGGFLWVWARGNSEQIDKAKEIVRGTVIGLIIVFASLGITQYVFFTVGDITGATTANETSTEGSHTTDTVDTL